MKKMAEKAKCFWQDKSGMGLAELLLILILLIVLLLLFKHQITDLLNYFLAEIIG